MHMCLMLSACQWAWVTGSMDEVRIPFLYHKAATYQFAREQLQKPDTAQSGDTMLAISALALTEVGHFGCSVGRSVGPYETDIDRLGRHRRAGCLVEAPQGYPVSS
jgi:hypothetical protein